MEWLNSKYTLFERASDTDTALYCTTQEQVRQLFLKIDADAGGTVDW